MERQEIKIDQEVHANLRTEYSALSSYFSSIVGFRLTLLGFYLAAIGLIFSGDWPVPIPVSCLGIVITLSLYIFELRTRILFHHLAKRAIEIEQVDWKNKNKAELAKPEEKNHNSALPLFSRLFPLDLEQYNLNSKISEVYSETPAMIFQKIPIKGVFISHSVALDIIYLFILVFFFISIFCNLLSNS